ncbi:MAG TPA: hypothetical protein VGB15_17865 [Longimicrobium sp.]|jgi:hypothetical protein
MTESNPKRWGEGVRITAPALASLHFDWEGSRATLEQQEAPMQVEYVLNLSRFNRLAMGVGFGLHVVGIEGLTASAVFRMTAELDPDSSEASEPETAFRQFAARIAPLAIYPFVREALASAAIRANLPSIVLPITNVGSVFTPDEIELPDPPSEENTEG